MIKITDTYYIDADDRCFTLCERKIKGEGSKPEEVGKEYFMPMKYYSSITEALRGLVDMFQRRAIQTRDMSLHEAIRAFREIQEQAERWAENVAGGDAG